MIVWQSPSEFLRASDGVTALEYALIASIIAVAIVVAVPAIATDLNSVFTNVAKHL